MTDPELGKIEIPGIGFIKINDEESYRIGEKYFLYIGLLLKRRDEERKSLTEMLASSQKKPDGSS